MSRAAAGLAPLEQLLPPAIVPLVVAFLLLQRYWQSGLATGSVKQ